MQPGTKCLFQYFGERNWQSRNAAIVLPQSDYSSLEMDDSVFESLSECLPVHRTSMTSHGITGASFRAQPVLEKHSRRLLITAGEGETNWEQVASWEKSDQPI